MTIVKRVIQGWLLAKVLGFVRRKTGGKGTA